MKLPLISTRSTLEDLAQQVRKLALAVAAGWNVQHADDGTHQFPWISVPFTAVRFSGASAMTWTVGVAGQVVLKYILIGTTMTVQYAITGTVGGVVASQLLITLPSGYQAVGTNVCGACSYDDAGTPGAGICTAEGVYLRLSKSPAAASWTAGTVSVYGVAVCEVTR